MFHTCPFIVRQHWTHCIGQESFVCSLRLHTPSTWTDFFSQFWCPFSFPLNFLYGTAEIKSRLNQYIPKKSYTLIRSSTDFVKSHSWLCPPILDAEIFSIFAHLAFWSLLEIFCLLFKLRNTFCASNCLFCSSEDISDQTQYNATRFNQNSNKCEWNSLKSKIFQWKTYWKFKKKTK